MKRNIVILLAIVTSVWLLWNFIRIKKSREPIILDKETSTFSHFEIKEEQVHIRCRLVFLNESEIGGVFSITAYSEADFEAKLISSAQMQVCDIDSQTEIVFAKGEKRIIRDICFVQNHAGGITKNDRLIPERIIIHSIKLDETGDTGDDMPL